MDAKALSQDLARLATRARKERKLSQRDFAGRLGLSQGTISNVEAGRQEPGLAVLAALVEIDPMGVASVLGLESSSGESEPVIIPAELETALAMLEGKLSGHTIRYAHELARWWPRKSRGWWFEQLIDFQDAQEAQDI